MFSVNPNTRISCFKPSLINPGSYLVLEVLYTVGFLKSIGHILTKPIYITFRLLNILLVFTDKPSTSPFI